MKIRTKAASIGMLSMSMAGGALLLPRAAELPGPTATVHQGAFAEQLVEPGTIGSGRLLVYGSTIAGAQAKIVELAPEGRTVQPGDVLIRFDMTGFEQNLAREEAALRQAEAEQLRAGEELRIERLRAEAETSQAEQQVGYAQRELSNQTDGRGRVVVAEVEAAHAEAQRDLDRAQSTHRDMLPMLERGFITRMELEKAEQAVQRAAEQLRLAKLRRDAMVGFERPAAEARSQADVESARQTLKRQRETARARLSSLEAAVRLASSRVDELRIRITTIRDQMSRCTVVSAAAGMVVYRDLFFGNDKRKPQVGDEVWSSQPIIALPDAERVTVETRIREIDLQHVSLGRQVEVTLEAYPDLRLRGTIAVIGALAEQDPSRAGTKFFPVTVALIDHNDRLRTGMSARVEIDVARIDNAVLVPGHAVFDVDGESTVYVVKRGRPEARKVVLESRNDRDAVVAKGVSVGETVLLVDPRQPSGAR